MKPIIIVALVILSISTIAQTSDVAFSKSYSFEYETQYTKAITSITDLKIDNAEEIKKVKQPFLWIHGTNDNFLNYKTHGQYP